MSKAKIVETWEEKLFSQKLVPYFGEGISLNKKAITCLKNTKKSSIWKMTINQKGNVFPIILKILPSLNVFRNRVEMDILQNTPDKLKPFIPKIYHIERTTEKGMTFILMEYVYTVEKEWDITPSVFEKIIPKLSLLHANTHEKVFRIHEQPISKSIPIYKSKKCSIERKKRIERTKKALEHAIKDPNLKGTIKPMYERIKTCLSSDNMKFDELAEAGHSIVHGDPHMINICLHKKNLGVTDDLVFIDWESAEYTSPWCDLSHFLMLIDFRADWQHEEEEILKRSVELYTSEMRKHGITFEHDSIKLFKMAYIQRALEKWLLYHLNNLLWKKTNPSSGILLRRALDKLDRWGRELNIL